MEAPLRELVYTEGMPSRAASLVVTVLALVLLACPGEAPRRGRPDAARAAPPGPRGGSQAGEGAATGGAGAATGGAGAATGGAGAATGDSGPTTGPVRVQPAGANPPADGVPRPPDLDVAAIVAALRSPPPGRTPGDGHARAIELATAFASAGPFVDFPADGKDVWFGRATSVFASGDVTTEYVFFQLAVPPGGERLRRGGVDDRAILPHGGYLGGFTPPTADFAADVAALLEALAQDRPLPAGTRSHDYLKGLPADNGPFAIARTDGTSHVFLAPPSSRYFRMAGRRLLMIERLPSESVLGGHRWTAAARYLELWKLP